MFKSCKYDVLALFRGLVSQTCWSFCYGPWLRVCSAKSTKLDLFSLQFQQTPFLKVRAPYFSESPAHPNLHSPIGGRNDTDRTHPNLYPHNAARPAKQQQTCPNVYPFAHGDGRAVQIWVVWSSLKHLRKIGLTAKYCGKRPPEQ